MEIFNELAVLLVSLITFGFTPLLDWPEARNILGWAVIAIILINFFGTIVVILHNMVQEIIHKCKSLSQKKKETPSKTLTLPGNKIIPDNSARLDLLDPSPTMRGDDLTVENYDTISVQSSTVAGGSTLGRSPTQLSIQNSINNARPTRKHMSERIFLFNVLFNKLHPLSSQNPSFEMPKRNVPTKTLTKPINTIEEEEKEGDFMGNEEDASFSIDATTQQASPNPQNLAKP